jgi:hypothetical protein
LSRRALFLCLLVAAALPAYAANIITRVPTSGSGSGFWSLGADEQAEYVSWTSTGPYYGVTFNAVVLNTTGIGTASATVYLTNKIGPTATSANVVAGPVTLSTTSAAPVSTPIPFSSPQVLPPGTYYLIIVNTTANLGWELQSATAPGSPAITTTAPDVTSNNDGIVLNPLLNVGTPYASTFTTPTPAQGTLFSVSGTPGLPPSIPTLSAWGLGGTTLLLLLSTLVLLRRRSQA